MTIHQTIASGQNKQEQQKKIKKKTIALQFKNFSHIIQKKTKIRGTHTRIRCCTRFLLAFVKQQKREKSKSAKWLTDRDLEMWSGNQGKLTESKANQSNQINQFKTCTKDKQTNANTHSLRQFSFAKSSIANRETRKKQNEEKKSKAGEI